MFDEAKNSDWLLTEDWNRYDMKESVWKSPVTNEDALKFAQNLYTSALNPYFIFKKIVSIRNVNDIKFMVKAGKKVIAHFVDFKKSNDRS